MKAAQSSSLAEGQMCLPSVAWSSLPWLYQRRPVTEQSRRAGWALFYPPQSWGDGEGARGAWEGIASASRAIVTRGAKIVTGRVTLEKSQKVEFCINNITYLKGLIPKNNKSILRKFCNQRFMTTLFLFIFYLYTYSIY